MPRYAALTPDLSVSPQIAEKDVADLARQGFRTLISNRPDREDWGQPPNETLARAAASHGMEFRLVPIASGTLPPQAIEDFARVLAECPKPALAFCRSGMRSAALWAGAEAGRADGLPVDAILRAAVEAGYDLRGLRLLLEQSRAMAARG